MSTEIAGMLMIGVEFNELPQKFKDLLEEDTFHEYLEENGLMYASQWYDSGSDGWLVGMEIMSTSEENFAPWCSHTKKQFKVVQKLLGVKPRLIGTQDVY